MTTLQSVTSLSLVTTGIAISLVLIGCADNGVTKASDVTLEAGMQSVGRGLALMKAAEIEAATNNGLNANFNTGLMPSEATVTFNIAASAGHSNQLMIDLSAPPTIPVKASGSDTFSSYASGSRANQITIKFSSLYFNTASSSSASTNGGQQSKAPGGGATNEMGVVAPGSPAPSKASGASDLNDPETVRQIIDIIKDMSTKPAGSSSPFFLISRPVGKNNKPLEAPAPPANYNNTNPPPIFYLYRQTLPNQ